MSVVLDSPDLAAQNKHLRTSQENCHDANIGASKISTSKPFYHLTAPHGWMNDPCGLGYDPSTGIYHLFFQWNPWGNDWGNMSWGHAISKDLVSWETFAEPAMTPSAKYDCRGVFTGCMRATDIQGKPGQLTAIYTSGRGEDVGATGLQPCRLRSA
jgi:beta-fructofuranosidase